MIGELGIVTILGAMLGGIPLSGAYPRIIIYEFKGDPSFYFQSPRYHIYTAPQGWKTSNSTKFWALITIPAQLLIPSKQQQLLHNAAASGWPMMKLLVKGP